MRCTPRRCTISALGTAALGLAAGCGRLGFDASAPGDGPATIREDAVGAAVGCASIAGDNGDVPGGVCDPCPPPSDGAASDGDGDGISDACDPAPGRRDAVWLFENFTVVPPSWSTDGRWSATGDHETIVFRAPSGGNDRESYLTLPLPAKTHAFDDFSLTVAFTVDATAGNAQPEIGLFVTDSATGMGLDCTLFQNGASSAARSLGLYDESKDGSRHTTSSIAFAWQIGARYTLTLTHHATVTDSMYTCAADGANHGTASQGSSVVPRSDNPIDLWVRDMTARVDWLYVIGPS